MTAAYVGLRHSPIRHAWHAYIVSRACRIFRDIPKSTAGSRDYACTDLATVPQLSPALRPSWLLRVPHTAWRDVVGLHHRKQPLLLVHRDLRNDMLVSSPVYFISSPDRPALSSQASHVSYTTV